MNKLFYLFYSKNGFGTDGIDVIDLYFLLVPINCGVKIK